MGTAKKVFLFLLYISIRFLCLLNQKFGFNFCDHQQFVMLRYVML